MAAVKKVASPAERVRLSQAVDIMNPAPLPPPEAEEVVIPSLSDVIEDRKLRLEVARVVTRVGEITQQLSQLNKEKKPLVKRLKVYAGELEIRQCVYEEWRVNYYPIPRTSVPLSKLTALLLKMGLTKQDGTVLDKKDMKKLIAKATEVKTSYGMRVAHNSDAAEVEEGEDE